MVYKQLNLLPVVLLGQLCYEGILLLPPLLLAALLSEWTHVKLKVTTW